MFPTYTVNFFRLFHMYTVTFSNLTPKKRYTSCLYITPKDYENMENAIPGGKQKHLS